MSDHPKPISCLLKVAPGTKPDAVNFEDQLKEIKTLTTSLLPPQLHHGDSSTRMTATIHAIPHPNHQKTYGLVTAVLPLSPVRASVSTQTRQSFHHRHQLGQVKSYQEQLLPATLLFSFSKGLPTQTTSHTLQPAPPKTCCYSESDDAQRKVQLLFFFYSIVYAQNKRWP